MALNGGQLVGKDNTISGIIAHLRGAGAPTVTTGVGQLVGTTYVDQATGVKYINVGTSAIPNWVTIGSQA